MSSTNLTVKEALKDKGEFRVITGSKEIAELLFKLGPKKGYNNEGKFEPYPGYIHFSTRKRMESSRSSPHGFGSVVSLDEAINFFTEPTPKLFHRFILQVNCQEVEDCIVKLCAHRPFYTAHRWKTFPKHIHFYPEASGKYYHFLNSMSFKADTSLDKAIELLLEEREHNKNL